MSPRARALSATVAVVLLTGWVVAAAAWMHAAQWSVRRADQRRQAFLRATDPAAADQLSPADAPHVLDSLVSGVGLTLPLAATVLLTLALVAAGYRWWALLAPALLGLLATARWEPLGGPLLLSSDVTSGAAPSPWWPWHQAGLSVLVAALPAVVALLADRSRTVRAEPRVPTRTALRRSGTAAALVVLIQVLLSPVVGLGAGDAQAWALAGTQVVVIVGSGLVAAGRARLAVLVAVLGGLVAVRLLTLVGPMSPGGGLWGVTDAGATVLATWPVVVGAVAVLGTPWLADRWVRVFRPADRAAPTA